MKEDPKLYAAALILAKDILNTRKVRICTSRLNACVLATWKLTVPSLFIFRNVYDSVNERAVQYRRATTIKNLGLKELIAEDDESPDDEEEGAKLEEFAEEEEAVGESVEESAQVVA